MSNPDPRAAAGSPAQQRSAGQLEMASVLFMDIVSYSLEPMERQSSLLGDLQQIVRETSEFQRAQQCNQIISLPTGDGMALVFFDTPLVAVECALQVARALRSQPELKLRMGVHTGPVYRINDINANMNVAGGGINMAQRVMDAGDAGHLIVSSAVADVLRHLSGWPQYLKDLGEHSVKHGVKMHLYAICTDDVANHEVPQKIKKAAEPQPVAPAAAIPVAPPPPAAQSQMPRGLYMAIGSVVTIVVLALALTKGPALFSGQQAASLDKPFRTPVLYDKEEQAKTQQQGSAPATDAPKFRDTAPAPSAKQVHADQERAASAPAASRTAPAAPQSTAQMNPAVQMPQQVAPQQQAAPPQQQQQQTAPQPDPATMQALRASADLLNNLQSRAVSVRSGLATMKQQQANMGLNLRGDIVAAEVRMVNGLADAQNALRSGDADRAKTSLQNAERALETIENFLGR